MEEAYLKKNTIVNLFFTSVLLHDVCSYTRTALLIVTLSLCWRKKAFDEFGPHVIFIQKARSNTFSSVALQWIFTIKKPRPNNVDFPACNFGFSFVFAWISFLGAFFIDIVILRSFPPFSTDAHTHTQLRLSYFFDDTPFDKRKKEDALGVRMLILKKITFPRSVSCGCVCCECRRVRVGVGN